MRQEIYDKLLEIDYSGVQNQIKTILRKYDSNEKENRFRGSSIEPLCCDIMGIASIIFMMMIDDSITSFDDFEKAFESSISDALGLHDVAMKQECIWGYIEGVCSEQRKELFAELRTLANDMDYEELVAYILFGDVTEEEDLTCTKTPLAISRLASKLLDIKADECVVDFSTGEKNFVPDIWLQNMKTTYKFFNTSEEMFDVFYYLRFALLGINVSNDIRLSMYDEEAEEILYDKAFLDYCTGIDERDYVYPFDVIGVNKVWRYVYRIIQLLKPNGKAVVIVPNVCTTSQKDERAREWFVSQGYIEAVIALPEKMYKGTNAAFTLLLLSHGNDEITFVNATDKGQMIRNGAKRMNSFSEEVIDEIAETVKGNTSSQIKMSSYAVFKRGGMLNPIIYCIMAGVSIEGTDFCEVIRSITRGVQIPSGEVDQLISEEPTAYKYLTPANIIDGVIQDDLPFLKTVEEKQKKYVANKGNIVISKNAELFKVALVEENNLLICSNLYKVEIDTEKMNPLFLKGYLESDIGRAELRKACSGSITPTLGVEAMKKIRISCPSLEEQEKVVEEYKYLSEEISKIQEELERLFVMRRSLFM